MVRKAKDFEVLEQLRQDRKVILAQLSIQDSKASDLEFRIKVAGFNGTKVNFEKLNKYFPQLQAVYTERLGVYKELEKLERRLDRIS